MKKMTPEEKAQYLEIEKKWRSLRADAEAFQKASGAKSAEAATLNEEMSLLAGTAFRCVECGKIYQESDSYEYICRDIVEHDGEGRCYNCGTREALRKRARGYADDVLGGIVSDCRVEKNGRIVLALRLNGLEYIVCGQNGSQIVVKKNGQEY